MPEQVCIRLIGGRAHGRNLSAGTWTILFKMGEKRLERAIDAFFRTPRRSPRHSAAAQAKSPPSRTRLKTSEGLSYYRRHARAYNVYNRKSLQRSSDGAFLKPLQRGCRSPVGRHYCAFSHSRGLRGLRIVLARCPACCCGFRTMLSTTQTARWCD